MSIGYESFPIKQIESRVRRARRLAGNALYPLQSKCYLPLNDPSLNFHEAIRSSGRYPAPYSCTSGLAAFRIRIILAPLSCSYSNQCRKS